MLVLFAPVSKSIRCSGGRLKPASTFAFGTIVGTAFNIMLALNSQKREQNSRTPKLLRPLGCSWHWRWWSWRCRDWRCGRRMRASGHYLARSLRAGSAAGKRHQRDVAGALDRDAEPTLVPRADSGHAAGKNLAALLHELRKDVGALVVDEVHLLDAELAYFFLAEILALAAGTPARTAAGTTWAAAFTTRTAMPATGTAVAAAGSVPTTAFAAWRSARGCC
jgi:hypothetical protein